jgi:outer membrane murein-binding lipoprotein Lpp
MSKMMRWLSAVLAGLFLVGTLVMTGCTRYANEEQLKQLEDTKNAALSAEQKVKDLEAQKANLEKELAAKKAELEKVKQEKATVKERLEQKKQQ